MTVDSDWMTLSGGPPEVAPVRVWTRVVDVDPGRDMTRSDSSCVRTILTMEQSATAVQIRKFASLDEGPGGPPKQAENLVLVGDEIDCGEEEGMTGGLVVQAPCFGET